MPANWLTIAKMAAETGYQRQVTRHFCRSTALAQGPVMADLGRSALKVEDPTARLPTLPQRYPERQQPAGHPTPHETGPVHQAQTGLAEGARDRGYTGSGARGHEAGSPPVYCARKSDAGLSPIQEAAARSPYTGEQPVDEHQKVTPAEDEARHV